MIYRWVGEGTFPRPCKPGGGASRWSEREVRAWKDEQLATHVAATWPLRLGANAIQRLALSARSSADLAF